MSLLVLFAALQFARPAQPVTFANGNTVLSGVLLEPEGRGPFPAVVLVHGAGPAKHDEPAFIVHANAFLASGFAVVAYDKRGNLDVASYRDLAGDVVAAVRFLQGRKEIARDAIGLLGRSEGGWVSTLAAANDPSIAFVIMSSGAAVPPRMEIVYWTRRALQNKGWSAERIDEAIALKKEIWTYQNALLDGTANASVRESLVRRLAAFPHPEVPSRVMTMEEDGRRKIAAIMSMIDFDPAPALARLRVPIMEVIGAQDDVVEPSTTIAALQGLRAKGHDITILELPDVGHSLLVMKNGQIVGYPPNYLPSVTEWARSRISRRAR